MTASSFPRPIRVAAVLAMWPFVAAADRLRGVNPPVSLRVGLRWAWTGRDEHQPTLPTAAAPAAVLDRKAQP